MSPANDGDRRRNKRKFNDFIGEDLDDLSYSVRVRNVDPNPNPNPNLSSSSNSQSSSAAVNSFSEQTVRQPLLDHGAENSAFLSPDDIQFFVRLMSDGKTLILHGRPDDRVKSIHETIFCVTGIPVLEQRLIYGGKQLHLNQSLAECMITKDSELHLVGRLRSAGNPVAWRMMDDLLSNIFRWCKGERGVFLKSVKLRLIDYLKLTPLDKVENAVSHLNVFLSSSAPAALVMLYLSRDKGNKESADQSIRRFINASRYVLPRHVYYQFAPIVFEFCTLLRRARVGDDPLYNSCRSNLGMMVEFADIDSYAKSYDGVCNKMVIKVEHIFSFVPEIVSNLLEGLVSSMRSVENPGPSANDVRDFAAFLRPLRAAIKEKVGRRGPIPMWARYEPSFYRKEIKSLYVLYSDLLEKSRLCLVNMECLAREGKRDGAWDQYLAILKELHDIATLFDGAEENFLTILRLNKISFCHLIVRFARRVEDYTWILEDKDLTNFESRRKLVTMLLPEVRQEYVGQHEMLIDRSQLLAESFEYLRYADLEALRHGLTVVFKNEEASGPGVLREWFFLVCQEIFNTLNALFVACPNDRRRLFPNQASKVEPLHLEYFRFAGRVIALALMHKIQVGIVFDRAFFLQLSETKVRLEDIKDADPVLYNSCREILDMDPSLVDQDALGLTFVREIEELGSMKTVELCPDGKNIIVNSSNRKEYVDLLVQHCFVTPIAEQVEHFARGFADIICDEETQKLYFRSLMLEDFDMILHGSESAISVDDWKAHTEYKGYNESDPQIRWFWKIVGGMTAEQRKTLLHFWTSIKYLPIEGFRGLPSKLQIHLTTESFDHLPSSHTCFYQLCFPAYPSLSMMRKRLNIIIQNHIGCSFGTA